MWHGRTAGHVDCLLHGRLFRNAHHEWQDSEGIRHRSQSSPVASQKLHEASVPVAVMVVVVDPTETVLKQSYKWPVVAGVEPDSG